MNQEEALHRLIDILCAERGSTPQDQGLDYSWASFRALVNTRRPQGASDEFLALQDELLQERIREAGVVDVMTLEPCAADDRIALWQGDIIRLKADAIVNAANHEMLGCWIPGHHCIDNAIHTFAGVQLRIECARIMEKEASLAPVGAAVLTPAYNLPAKFVIHTVGPVAGGAVTAEVREQLASCYRNCLDAAARNHLRSLVFCCISTGVFGFPADEAADIAVSTTRSWLDEAGATAAGAGGAEDRCSIARVVFDVFSDEDLARYERLLS